MSDVANEDVCAYATSESIPNMAKQGVAKSDLPLAYIAGPQAQLSLLALWLSLIAGRVHTHGQEYSIVPCFTCTYLNLNQCLLICWSL